ncbi:DUF167 domain-containing protein [bacterium]|nr:DUF167 domain-containing protein [bacterium]
MASNQPPMKKASAPQNSVVITVKVVPQAKKARVVEEAGGLKVYVTAPALEGRANDALIAALAEHFALRPSQIAIMKGLQSRRKMIKITP